MRLLLVSALVLGLAACQSDTTTNVSAPAPGATETAGAGVQARHTVRVSSAGFQPAAVEVPAGSASTLTITREDEAACTGLLMGSDGLGLSSQELPVGQAVEVTVSPAAGVYQLECSETGAALIIEAR